MNNVWIMVAGGGALGAVSRYGVSKLTGIWNPDNGFPWHTFIVNILGCFLIGGVMQFTNQNIDKFWIRPMFVLGFLGGFTTFSSFGYETFQLLQSGRWTMMLIYAIGSTILGLAAVVIGVKAIDWVR